MEGGLSFFLLCLTFELLNIHLVPRLRINGALPLLPLYAFMAWTGKTLPSILPGNRFLQAFLVNIMPLKNTGTPYF
jgi:hypothetical protein